jgi:hypothetical protein
MFIGRNRFVLLKTMTGHHGVHGKIATEFSWHRLLDSDCRFLGPNIATVRVRATCPRSVPASRVRLPVMTPDQLERMFALHMRVLKLHESVECYFAVLHVVLALPDICGALESDDGVSKGCRYRKWCNDNLPCAFLTGADRYKLRCAVLHQGSSLPDDKGPKSDYASFSLVTPDNVPAEAHGQITSKPDGLNLTLDVAQLADEMATGLRRWFADLQCPEHAARLANVVKHRDTLMRIQEKQLSLGNVTLTISTASSTGTSHY